ncbi:hypothetical protein E2C01_009038 [Portunus trituberculatus]|uniref:Fibronectin type-III domain-containing protein n=1 Tax=Portunus trituberculatus TaxID=210409 RepID=A0A5B7D3V5_PORTR|nr:hypothetical protein [Portunus trituberculatus]
MIVLPVVVVVVVATIAGVPKVPRITSSSAGADLTSYTIVWRTESHTPIVMYRLQYRIYMTSSYFGLHLSTYSLLEQKKLFIQSAFSCSGIQTLND